jgi:hypothetical protein
MLANANIKSYRLLSPDGSTYESSTPGNLGGYAPLRIYGRLDCWSANKHLRKGGYAQHRVFFADEEAAIAGGFRPCGHCLRDRYKRWKQGGIPASADYPWLILPARKQP